MVQLEVTPPPLISWILSVSNCAMEILFKANFFLFFFVFIITSYFDVIEVTDRETGYLRTSWEVKSFKQNTIRTRMIVKLGTTDPLSYKIKLVSEESFSPNTSVKSDELFREWDRVLRKFQNVIDELQSRLSK